MQKLNAVFFTTPLLCILIGCMQFFFLQDLQSGNPDSSHRASFSSNASDNDRPRQPGGELAYSFVGMHCIFDQCKASGNFSLCTNLCYVSACHHKVELHRRNPH